MLSRGTLYRRFGCPSRVKRQPVNPGREMIFRLTRMFGAPWQINSGISPIPPLLTRFTQQHYSSCNNESGRVVVEDDAGVVEDGKFVIAKSSRGNSEAVSSPRTPNSPAPQTASLPILPTTTMPNDDNPKALCKGRRRLCAYTHGRTLFTPVMRRLPFHSIYATKQPLIEALTHLLTS